MGADPLPMLAIAVVGVPLVLGGYIYLSERLLGRGARKANSATRAAFWLAPALVLLLVFLVYPIVTTIVLSFKDATSASWAGLSNYGYVFTDRNMLVVLRNNLLWLVFFTLVTLTLGLLIALLADRVKYEAVAKSLIFLPMAISFVAAGIIWKFMYDFQPGGAKQVGTLNALITTVAPGFKPVAWLFDTSTNNAALIVVGIWMWTGFAMVILSAGLKGIPVELLEAARIDGASELQVLSRVTLPLLGPTLIVVATTLIIDVLKIFDVVYVMTNGNLGTEVVANRMYKEMFNYHNYGRASAMAVLLLVVIAPVMILNVRRFRQGGSNA
jgi:alpha-glucoside transport system permease protein